MINLSVLVRENGGSPHLHLYPKTLPITCKCKERRGDNKFSILCASSTGFVKNVRVLSHRCNITYTGWNCFKFAA